MAIYKPRQGSLVRGLSFLAGALASLGVVQSIAERIQGEGDTLGISSAITAILFLMFCWFFWRLVNYPALAEFLIEVHGEGMRVGWAGFSDVKRTSAVVVAVMVTMGAYLFICDIFLQSVLRFLRVLSV